MLKLPFAFSKKFQSTRPRRQLDINEPGSIPLTSFGAQRSYLIVSIVTTSMKK
jgi:hypothetical protein